MFLADLGEFFLCDLEAEGVREAVEIAGDGLVEGGGGSAVKESEVGVQNHLLATDDVDETADVNGVNSDDVGCPMHEYIIQYLGRFGKSFRTPPTLVYFSGQ